ncbi:MAG TPA: alpha/beta hydrolase [Gammaproteobacteria bacterium]|nr:alpha/beta hydrolase [Gammaproteobacteria bacterium]
MRLGLGGKEMLTNRKTVKNKTSIALIKQTALVLMTRRVPALCLVLLLAVTHAKSAVANQLLELQPCDLSQPNSAVVVKAECGSLSVAENPREPEGRRIDLHVAVLTARTDSPQSDPVMVLAGGPGQSAIDMLASSSQLFREIAKSRDLIFVDQRGTGRSNPLHCDYAESDALSVSNAALAAMTERCLQVLTADPRFYTTAQAVDDLEQVRLALGVERVSLLGFSYGTRVAQEYLRRYEASVRTIVVDGVLPPQHVLGLGFAENLERVVALLIEECAADSGCAETFPNIRQDYQKYLSLPPQAEVDATLRHPGTGRWENAATSREVADAAVRLFSYAPETQALLPAIIHGVVAGDWRTVTAQALILSGRMQSLLAMGMQNSVMCSEDIAYFSNDLAINDAQMLGNMDDALRAVCSVWPIGEANPDVHTPLQSAVPALLLSGELDPVTPPSFGAAALTQFENGEHIVAQGVGHGVMLQPCFQKLVADYIDLLQLPDPIPDCAAKDWRLPPYISPAGPRL